MFQKTKVCTGVLIALGVLAQPAMAQSGERVEITGSRIKSIGSVSNSPITSVTAEEFNTVQPVAAEEIVRSLSASYPGIGPGTNNGSNGTASIDLRGLGTNRTLVLLNGRRIVPATLGGVVDTNAIPLSLIDRIDVVTGGASAVYGADAVSGVVNFVMKRNFRGVEASTTYGVSEQGDAKRYSSSVTLGSALADNRGNVALNIGTTRTEPLTQGEREFGFFSLNSANGIREGSGTAVPAFIVAVPGFGGNRIYDPATGTLRPATAADAYNFNPPNYYITPQERVQVTALGNFSINDNAEVYAEVMHTKNKVTLNLAESGSFTSTYSIPIGNPFIPEPLRATLCTAFATTGPCAVGNTQEVRFRVQRRFTELGPRINDFDNNTTQYTVGLRGTLPFLSNWAYDGYFQKGTSTQTSARVNWGSFSKVQQALRAVDPARCIDTSNGCVPLNLFGAAGTITPAMLNFINLTSVQGTNVEQQVSNVTFSGDLGAAKSPLSKSPISLAIGFEMRDVGAGNRSDGPSQIQGEVLGTGAPTPDRKGTIKLNEQFVEIIAPLVQGLPGVHSLGLEGGYRQTNFKTEATSRNYGSWKLGLDYAPIKGLRFRAMQQRATRAPSVNELYAPVITGLSNLGTDLCAGPTLLASRIDTPGTIENLCVATGVPRAQIGSLSGPSAGQINTTGGGNLALGPEEADTTTLGVVFEPSFAPGLSLSVDYFKIDIQKGITGATTQQVYNGCYTAALNPGLSPSAPFCAFVRRDSAGTLNSGPGIITQSANLGTFLVEGYDLDVKYRLPLKDVGLDAKWGRVDVALTASLLDKWQIKTIPTVATIECAGLYGLNCGNPYFKTRFTQRSTWNVGAFSLGYEWRYYSGVKVEESNGTTFPDYRSIPERNYFDLYGSWDVTKNFTLSATIKNLRDSGPPIVGNTIGGTAANSGNTFPQWYDVVGRAYSFTARLKF